MSSISLRSIYYILAVISIQLYLMSLWPLYFTIEPLLQQNLPNSVYKKPQKTRKIAYVESFN